MIHWRSLLTERDLQVYRQRGHRKVTVPGSRPAILIIDVNYFFLGPEPVPILESIKDWPQSCGLEGWQCLPVIEKLAKAARARAHPVFYTTGDPRRAEHLPRRTENIDIEGKDIPSEIAPQDGDYLLVKEKASAFHGTPLLSRLIQNRIDTAVVVGCTTSGCVRATVVDAASFDFHVIVVEEATFDRTQASHAIGLFDMHAKYAQVISLSEALRYLSAPGKYEPIEIGLD